MSQNAYDNTVLDESNINGWEELTKELSEIYKFAAVPFKRPEEYDYFGGKEGLDIADPLDLAWSTGSSAYRLYNKLLRNPAVKSLMYTTDILSSLLGNEINSLEELEAFRNKYDPEGLTDQYALRYDETPGGNNYFELPDGISGGAIGVSPHIDYFSLGTGGVNPITAAEEVEHARRFADPETTSGGELRKNNPIVKATGELGEYVANLYEETMAKGTALANVTKNEGILEALASIPSTLGTWGSYVTPAAQPYSTGGLGQIDVMDHEHWVSDLNAIENPFFESVANKYELYKDQISVQGFEELYSNIELDTYENYAYGKSNMVTEKVPTWDEDKIKSHFGEDITVSDFATILRYLERVEKRQEAGLLETIKNWWKR